MPRELNPGPPVPRGRSVLRARCTVVLAVVLGACSPTLDWRAVRVPDSELVAQFPCRPGKFQRDVVVADTPLQLFMLSCEAGGVTYGVATTDVRDPTRVEHVLTALADGSRSAIHADSGAFAAFQLQGATPFRGNASARLHGSRPDGRVVEESVRLFARGTRLFQVSAIGAVLSESTVRPFEDGLRFDLVKIDTDPR